MRAMRWREIPGVVEIPDDILGELVCKDAVLTMNDADAKRTATYLGSVYLRKDSLHTAWFTIQCAKAHDTQLGFTVHREPRKPHTTNQYNNRVILWLWEPIERSEYEQVR